MSKKWDPGMLGKSDIPKSGQKSLAHKEDLTEDERNRLENEAERKKKARKQAKVSKTSVNSKAAKKRKKLKKKKKK